MLRSAHGEAFEMEQELLQLDGADLEWWDLTISMSSLGLKILGLTSEVAFLFFGSPVYVDMPLSMHNVRVRLATPSSLEALLVRLHLRSGFLARWIREMSWKEIIHITCEEGEYFVGAGFAEIHVGAAPNIESLTRIKEAIVYCGVDPAAEEFWEGERD